MVITLHKWTSTDKKALMALCNAVDRTFLSDRLPYPYTEADADWWLGMVAENEGKKGVWRSIWADEELVGSISVERKDDGGGAIGEIGYMILTPFWSQGIGTEAVRQMCGIAFEVLGLERITATVYEGNLASERVLEKNRFQLVETKDKDVVKCGRAMAVRVYQRMVSYEDNGKDPVTYTVRLFDPKKFSGKVFNGQKDAPKRCRFCGRVLDSSHFTKEAHAISISLGNTKFICADECDECNERFGKRLENDVTNFFQVFLSIYQVPKRKGKERQVAGRNFEMQMSNEPHPFSDLPLLRIRMHDWKDESISAEDVAEMMKEFDLTNKTFIPQNIYKAICKYALSLMPHSATLHYQKTIEWLQGDSCESDLPSVKIASFDREGNEPIMVIFLRNAPSKEYPFCVASLCVANIHMFYVLPFCDESTGVESDNAQFGTFWERFTKAHADLDSYDDCDLSNAQRIGFKFDFDLTFEPGAVPIKLTLDDKTGQWVIDGDDV